MKKPSFLGFGLGLRIDHFRHVLEHLPPVDWFEILSENFMVPGGKPKYYLHAIREHYKFVMHGVSLSIGSTDPIDWDYLKNLKALRDEIQPEWISDHLCWTNVEGTNSHDLLPLPYTEEALQHVADRVIQIQDYLGQRILLENVSSYLTFDTPDSGMEEWTFFSEVCQRADCLQLVDVNNIYVSARNHHFEPKTYIDHLDPSRVCQFHLAGHSDYETHVIDTHDQDVCDPVWDLYRYALSKLGPVSTMIERDSNIPPFDALFDELCIAKKHFREILGTTETI